MARAKVSKKRAGGQNQGTGSKKQSRPMMSIRTDHGARVETYFAKLKGAQRELAQRLDAIVRKAVPGGTSAVKWGMPLYDYHGMLCYIRAHRTYVSLGFMYHGTDLDDPKGLLEGSGKTMRHVKCAIEKPPPAAALKAMVKQAARMNERDPAC